MFTHGIEDSGEQEVKYSAEVARISFISKSSMQKHKKSLEWPASSWVL